MKKTTQLRRILGFGKQNNIQEVVVSPSLARKLLQFNTENRPVRPRHLTWLVQQMKGDHWKFNGDTVRFDKKGILRDGQHRLMAIIESNKSQKFIVVLGLDDGVMPTIDTGLLRSASDVLALNGIKKGTLCAAIVKDILKTKGNNFSNNGQKGNSKKLITNDIILDFAFKNKHTLEKVCNKALELYREFKFLSPSFYGVNYYNIHISNEIKANEFFHKLTTGERITRSDSIFHFRKKLIDTKLNGLKMNNKTKYFYIYKCWAAFEQGEKMKALPVFKKDFQIPVLN